MNLNAGKAAPAIDAARVACGAFQPITWSARDTDETLAQIKEHNAAWKALCGGAR